MGRDEPARVDDRRTRTGSETDLNRGVGRVVRRVSTSNAAAPSRRACSWLVSPLQVYSTLMLVSSGSSRAAIGSA